jgi:hypothetical protein
MSHKLFIRAGFELLTLEQEADPPVLSLPVARNWDESLVPSKDAYI